MDINETLMMNEYRLDIVQMEAEMDQVNDMIRMVDMLHNNPSKETIAYVRLSSCVSETKVTVEEFNTCPTELLCEMCMEGLIDGIKRMLKAIWDTILNICQKIIRFIKSFFTPKNESLQDKVNSFMGVVDEEDVNHKVRSEPLKIDIPDFDQMEARILAHQDIFNNVLMPLRPGHFKWTHATDPNEIDLMSMDEILSDMKKILASHPNNGYRFMGNMTLNFEQIKLRHGEDLWKSKWSDSAAMNSLTMAIEQISAGLMSLLGLEAIVKKDISTIATYWEEDVLQNSFLVDEESRQDIIDNSKALMGWFNYVKVIMTNTMEIKSIAIGFMTKTAKKIQEKSQRIAEQMETV